MNKGYLEVNGLTKCYGASKVVDHLNFEMNKGEILGFLGPNGAGKTTTINMICGLIDSDEGIVKLAGKTLNGDKAERSRIGMCPQNIVIWKDLTCIEQIEFVGNMHDMPTKIARERGLMLLEALKLTDKKNKRGKTLSGGMQRRLNIILALIHDPELLVLDEPEAGLDPQSRILVREYIKSLAGEKTILLTTHDMDEAERLSDRVAIIDHGKLIAMGTPEELKSHNGQQELLQIEINDRSLSDSIIGKMIDAGWNAKATETGITVSADRLLQNINQILSCVTETGANIEDVRIRKRTLEDLFISLTGRGLRE